MYQCPAVSEAAGSISLASHWGWDFVSTWAIAWRYCLVTGPFQALRNLGLNYTRERPWRKDVAWSRSHRLLVREAIADCGVLIAICSRAALPPYTANATDGLLPWGSGNLNHASSGFELKMGGLQSSTCSSGLFVCGVTFVIP